MIRPMRGQVVVRLSEPPASAALWTPTPGPREVRTHRGVVLAMGPPARTAGGVEVEPGFAPGDVVQFHFGHHQETATNVWTDGKPATWIPQSSVDAVWEALAQPTRQVTEGGPDDPFVRIVDEIVDGQWRRTITPRGYADHIECEVQFDAPPAGTETP